jgi:hypothetical protein
LSVDPAQVSTMVELLPPEPAREAGTVGGVVPLCISDTVSQPPGVHSLQPEGRLLGDCQIEFGSARSVGCQRCRVKVALPGDTATKLVQFGAFGVRPSELVLTAIRPDAPESLH